MSRTLGDVTKFIPSHSEDVSLADDTLTPLVGNDGVLYWQVGGRRIQAIIGFDGEADPDDDPDDDNSEDDDEKDGDSPDDEKDGKKDSDKTDVDALERQLRKARSEARNLRRRLKEASDKDGDKKDDTDKKTKSQADEDDRVAALEARAKASEERARKEAFRAAAAAAGAVNADTAYAIAKGDLDVDPDTGDIENLADVISELKEDHPYLFEKARRTNGTGDTPSGDRGKKLTLKERQERIQKERTVNPFDPDVIERMGGGVRRGD